MNSTGRLEMLKSALPVSGTPSMMEANAMPVGMMRDKVNPPRANKLRNSASERWQPPVHTNILTSLAAAPRLASDDAIVFAALATTVLTSIESSIADFLRSQPACIAYAERMRARFFPELTVAPPREVTVQAG
jgi:hypothetical protein